MIRKNCWDTDNIILQLVNIHLLDGFVVSKCETDVYSKINYRYSFFLGLHKELIGIEKKMKRVNIINLVDRLYIAW